MTYHQRRVIFTTDSADQLELARDELQRQTYQGLPLAYNLSPARGTPSAAGTRLKLAKTEAMIEPNGGTGPVRCYSKRLPVGVPLTPDAGQIMAELLWMDNDEPISAGIEVLLAFFPDLVNVGGTLGGNFDAGNIDWVSIPTLTTDMALKEFNITWTLTKLEPNPVAIYDDILSRSSTAGSSFGIRIDRTVPSLQTFWGGGIGGITRKDFSLDNVNFAGIDWDDGQPHDYRLYFNGVLPPSFGGRISFWLDGVAHSLNPSALTGVRSDTLAMVVGRNSSTSRSLHGILRDFTFQQVSDATQRVYYPFNETGSGTNVADISGNAYDGTLSSANTTSFWALNQGAAKSGWLIIGADCETPANQTGAAP